MTIDVNTSLGRWPFRDLDAENPRRLEAALASAGITRALVSSIEAILLPAPEKENARLFARLRGSQRLRPVPVVNPTLPQWPEAICRYADRAPAVKVHPNYHGYALDDAGLAAMMRELARRKLALLLPLRVEDERTHHPLMKVPAVPVEAVLRLARAFPAVPVVCLCPYAREAAALLQGPPNLHVDIAMIDGLDPVRALVKETGARRVLFGSHTPFLAAPAAILKVKFAEIPMADRSRIAAGNARRVFRQMVPTRTRS